MHSVDMIEEKHVPTNHFTLANFGGGDVEDRRKRYCDLFLYLYAQPFFNTLVRINIRSAYRAADILIINSETKSLPKQLSEERNEATVARLVLAEFNISHEEITQ